MGLCDERIAYIAGIQAGMVGQNPWTSEFIFGGKKNEFSFSPPPWGEFRAVGEMIDYLKERRKGLSLSPSLIKSFPKVESTNISCVDCNAGYDDIILDVNNCRNTVKIIRHLPTIFLKFKLTMGKWYYEVILEVPKEKVLKAKKEEKKENMEIAVLKDVREGETEDLPKEEEVAPIITEEEKIEVEQLLAHKIKIGFFNSKFFGSSSQSQGVGDIPHSWALCHEMEDSDQVTKQQETTQEKEEKRNLNNKKFYIQRMGVCFDINEEKKNGDYDHSERQCRSETIREYLL